MHVPSMGVNVETTRVMLNPKSKKARTYRNIENRRLKSSVQKKLIVKHRTDPLYKSFWLQKLGNKIMKSGKRGKADKILVLLLQRLVQLGPVNSQFDGILLFHSALDSLRPLVGIAKQRIGYKVYEIPVALSFDKQYQIVLSWLAEIIKEQKLVKAETIAETLARELIFGLFSQKGLL